MKYHKINFNKGSQGGFTLIELLTVVVILGILAYVSMSAFSGSPNSANATAVRSAATEIAKGVGYINANLGNGIKTKSNPIMSGSTTMLDVLIVGDAVVTASYKPRFQAIEMRPLESEFKIENRPSAIGEVGKYSMITYDVSVTDDCPVRKVCTVFEKVPDAVRDEILNRYGLDKAVVNKITAGTGQNVPVEFKSEGSGLNTVKFALVP